MPSEAYKIQKESISKTVHVYVPDKNQKLSMLVRQFEVPYE